MSIFPTEPTFLIRPLHVWQLEKKSLIQKLFWFLYFLVIVSIPFGWMTMSSDPRGYGVFAELGRKFGAVAVITYSLSLLPGVLKRFQIWPMTMVLLNSWRRQIGVLTFFLVLAHQFLVRTIPLAVINPDLLQTLGKMESLGFYAYLIFFVMWLTSSDRAQNAMGAWWKRLHGVTHIAVWLVFFHVMLTTELSVKIIVGAILCADVVSWIVAISRGRQRAKLVATQVE